jgi:hypothetical protein
MMLIKLFTNIVSEFIFTTTIAFVGIFVNDRCINLGYGA